MVFINQDQILGDIIPDVSISKITLETRGDTLIERNPHIDHSREPDVVKDRFGRNKREKLSVGFANKPKSSEPLFVTVDLTMKEKLDDSLVGTWFNNQDFSKYLKLKVFQVTKRDICQAVTEEKEFLDVIDKTRATPFSKIRKDFAVGKLAQRLGFIGTIPKISIPRLSAQSSGKFEKNTNLDPKRFLKTESLKIKKPKLVHEKVSLPKIETSKFKKTIQNNVEVKTLSVDKDVIGDNTKITQHKSETDSDGNVITSFTYRVHFRIPNRNPEHLSYFAFSYLDLIQMVEDFNMSLDIGKFQDPIGRVVSDVVIDNGSVIGDSFIFTDEENKIWVGAVSEIEPGIFIGQQKDGSEVSLIRRRVGNSKIQDFRNFEDMEKLSLDFSIIENELADNVIKNPRKDRFGIREPRTCFSDICLSRDDEGNARFFFSFDFKRSLEFNSKYGKIFKRKMVSDFALPRSHILSMKIIRRRIGGSPEAGSIQKPNEVFNVSGLSYGENDIPDTVVVSGEKSFDNFKTTNNDNGSLREIRNLFVEGQNLSGIRHFTGTDKTMFPITDGYYRYGVELEVQDGVIEFFQQQVDELEKAYLDLNDYFQEGTQLGASEVVIAIDEPHLDLPEEKRKVRFEERKGNFDPTTGRFSRSFIDKQQKKYRHLKRNSIDQLPPWSKAVGTYVKMLELFSDEKISDSVIDALNYLVHPATGNPSGILRLLKLIEQLQKNIKDTLGFSSGNQGLSSIRTQKKDSTAQKSRSEKAHSPVRSFKLFFMFDSVFDSNIPKDTGFDFLNVEGLNDNLGGLKVITGEQYTERVERETNHYFIRKEGIRPNIDLAVKDQVFTKNDSLDNTSFSFLTPAKLSLRGSFSFTRLGRSPVPSFDREFLAQVGVAVKSSNTRPTASPSRPETKVNAKKTLTSIEKSNQILRAKTTDYFADLNVIPIVRPQFDRSTLSEVVFPLDSERPEKKVDPVVEPKTECPVDIEHDPNINPIPLLLELAKTQPIPLPDAASPPETVLSPPKTDPLGTRINVIEPTTTVKTTPLPTTSVRKRQTSLVNTSNRKITLRNFDLLSKKSAINKVSSDPSLASSNMWFQGKFHLTTLSDAMMRLPNQIKSLYLSRVQPGIIRKNWFANKTDPITSRDDETEFKLSYKMINTVLVFNGYELSKDGKPLIKKPLWEPLTLEKYNTATGEALFCRLKPYENKIIGLHRDKDLELPTYDEYFILRPQRDAIGIEGIPPKTPTFPRIRTKLGNIPLKVTVPIEAAIKPEIGSLSVDVERDINGNLPLKEIGQLASRNTLSELTLKFMPPVDGEEGVSSVDTGFDPLGTTFATQPSITVGTSRGSAANFAATQQDATRQTPQQQTISQEPTRTGIIQIAQPSSEQENERKVAQASPEKIRGVDAKTEQTTKMTATSSAIVRQQQIIERVAQIDIVQNSVSTEHMTNNVVSNNQATSTPTGGGFNIGKSSFGEGSFSF